METIIPPNWGSTPIKKTNAQVGPDSKEELGLFGDDSLIRDAISKRPFGSSEEDPGIGERLTKYTYALCQGVGAIHRLHHCPPALRAQLYNGIVRFLNQFTTDILWVKGAKYFLTFPIARYLGNPEPTCPGKPVLYQKRYHRWLQCRYNKFSEKNTFFFTSWLQAKRNCEPLSEHVILDSFKSHRQGMQTSDPLGEDTLEEIFEEGSNFVRLLNLVKRKLHKNLSKRRREMKPSHHASFLATRQVGGQRFDLITKEVHRRHGIFNPGILSGDVVVRGAEWVDAEITQNSPHPLDFYWEAINESVDRSSLRSMSWHPCGVVGGSPKSNLILEVRTCDIFDDILRNSKTMDWSRMEDFTESSEDDPLLLDTFSEGTIYRPAALVAPVLEPLKVRLVSAGPSTLYYSLKQFQLDLHDSLRGIPIFQLIGRSQCPTDLSDILPNDLRYFLDPLWLSADYQSATDNLSSSLSERILTHLSNGDLIFHRAQKALGSHHCFYPDVKIPRMKNVKVNGRWTRKLVPVPISTPSVIQTNGQLMGSIVSFPLLCLANAAALDRYQRLHCRGVNELSFDSYLNSARINGDDLVTVVDGPSSLFKFKEISKELGLDLTVGKSYIHPTYANINSTAYHYNLRGLQERAFRDPTSSLLFNSRSEDVGTYHHLNVPRDIGYFNVGLYGGRHKVLNRVGSESTNDQITELDPEFSTEIKDPFKYLKGTSPYDSNLPNGAKKLLNRLQKRGIVQIPNEENDRPLRAVATRVWRGTPDHLKDEVQRELSSRIAMRGEDLFLYKFPYDKGGHKGRWRWARLNHRVPLSAGGLGLFPESKLKFRLTRTQRKIRSLLIYCTQRAGYEIETSLPTRKRVVPPVVARHPFEMPSETLVSEIATDEYSIDFYLWWEKNRDSFPRAGGIIPIGGYPTIAC